MSTFTFLNVSFAILSALKINNFWSFVASSNITANTDTPTLLNKHSHTYWGISEKLFFFSLSADKLAFVGFKGSFRPNWVKMAVDKEHAKLHQVLPVPIVRVMKLWNPPAPPLITHAQPGLLNTDSQSKASMRSRHFSHPDQCAISMYVIMWPLCESFRLCCQCASNFCHMREKKKYERRTTFLVLFFLSALFLWCLSFQKRKKIIFYPVKKQKTERFQIINIVRSEVFAISL